MFSSSDDGSPETNRIGEIVSGLRDTLSDEMATKAYWIRFKREPTASELPAFKELLVNEHYDEGFNCWVEKYLYFDPRA